MKLRHFLLLLFLSLLNSSCSALDKTPPPQQNRYEFSRPEMGVPFRIVLYALTAEVAEKAAQAAFDRIRQLNGILSDYEYDSELSQLSRSSSEGTEVPVSPELWFVLERSQGLSARSAGAFDITLGPAVNLWRRARRIKQMPDSKLLEEARILVGYQNLKLKPEKPSARLLVSGMRLDLGGIAKGYAVDEAMKVLLAHGIKQALVGGDGDILAGDPPPGQSGWRIATTAPDTHNAATNQYVLLKHMAISTSGDLSQRLEINGRRYSHIVDPRTGIGLTDHGMVTVIAPDSITADSLATAISVLGPEAGMKLAKSYEGVEVRIFRQPGEKLETYQSSGFAAYLEPAKAPSTN